MQKTWLADGITDENGPTAKRVGAEILGRAFAHERIATGELIVIAGFEGLRLASDEFDHALRAYIELLGG